MLRIAVQAKGRLFKDSRSIKLDEKQIKRRTESYLEM